ncbi:unnamed protein product [Vicia faba]|uniref:Uncharacterized protein n=1 Tax=Vicia faba TaxID=3906 RepID=A0AAV1B1P5_VICFA|nr:unnamed protein product [Vicia faba]
MKVVEIAMRGYALKWCKWRSQSHPSMSWNTFADICAHNLTPSDDADYEVPPKPPDAISNIEITHTRGKIKNVRKVFDGMTQQQQHLSPITCQRICFCALGSPCSLNETIANKSINNHATNGFLNDVFVLGDFIANGFPKVMPPAPKVVPVGCDVVDEFASMKAKRVVL